MVNKFRPGFLWAAIGALLAFSQVGAAAASPTNGVPACLHIAPPVVDLQEAPPSFWGTPQTKVVISARVTSSCDDLWIVRLRIDGIDPTVSKPVVQRTIVLRAVPHESTTGVNMVMLSTNQAQRIQMWNQVVVKLKRVPAKP